MAVGMVEVPITVPDTAMEARALRWEWRGERPLGKRADKQRGRHSPALAEQGPPFLLPFARSLPGDVEGEKRERGEKTF